MDYNTRIIFQGSDDGASATMKKLRESAKELSREIISASLEQADSGKDLIKIVEDQIRAIERRNKADASLRQTDLDLQFKEKAINFGEHKKRSAEVQREFQEDSLQVEILRDIVNTLKENARAEMSERREEVQRRIDLINENPQAEQDLSEEDRFRLKIQKDKIAPSTPPPTDDQGGEQQEDKRGDGGRRAVAVAQQSLNNITSARNDVFAAAAFLTMIPMVGSAVAGLVNKTLSEGNQLDIAKGRLQGLTTDRISTAGANSVDYGITTSQFIQQYQEQAARAQGQARGSAETGQDVLALEKGLGLSSSSIVQTLRTLRQADDQSIVRTIGTLISDLQSRGVVSTNDFTKIEEYLNIANDLSQSQISRLDKIDVGVNTSLVSEFARLGGSFANPQALGQVMRAIDQGIQNPSTPYAQAMQYATLSRLNPNASRFEIMEMQEKGIQDPRILQGMLEQLRGVAGGNVDMFNEQVKALFPQLSYAQVSRFGQSYMSGEFDLSRDQGKGINEDAIRMFLKGRAPEVTSDLQRRTASLDNILAVQGERINAQIGKLVDQFGGFNGILNGILDAGVGTLHAMNSLVSAIKGSSNQKTASATMYPSNQVKRK